MASKNLGRVGFVPKGGYDPETEYNRLDVVSYQGAAYVVRVDGLTGVTPGTDPDSYLVLVDNAAAVTANQAAAAANAAAEAVSGDVAELKSAFALFQENIPGTVQTIAFDSAGNIQSVTHKENNVVVRTDVFTFASSTITEVRTLASGESLTIVTNTETLETTTTYAAA